MPESEETQNLPVSVEGPKAKPSRSPVKALPRPSTYLALALAAIILGACSRDPQAAGQKYLASGAKYAKKSDYKAAIIEYQNALSYDRKNVDALSHLAEAYLANRQPREAYAALMQAVAIDPNRVDIRLNLGRLYLGAGDYKKAEEQLTPIIEKDPNHIAAQQLLGASLAGRNEPQKALEVFSKVAELAPNDPASFVNLGVSQNAAGNRTEAERSFQKAIQLDPRHLPAYLAKAEIHRRNNQFALAEQVLQQGIDANPDAVNLYLAQAALLAAQSKNEAIDPLLAKLRDRVRKPEVARALGDFFAARNQRGRAIAEYRRGLDQSPADLELKARLVEQHLGAGELKEAERWNSEILKERPKDVRAGIARGRILLAQDKRDEAAAELRQQVSQARDSVQAHHYLALAYVRNMQHAQAKAEFQEAMRLGPGFLPSRLGLAELHMNLGELAPAREIAEAAVAGFPRNARARSLLGSVLLRQRSFAAARDHLLISKSLAPQDPAVLVMLGVSYAGERKWEEARREFESALAVNPRYAPALAELTAIWTVNGQSAKAIGRLQQHTSAYPDDAEAFLLLGSASRQARDYPRAEAALARAAQLSPRNVRVRLQLGGIYEDQGRTDAAIQQYEYALSLEPRSSSLHALLGTARLRKGEVQSARKHFEQGLAIDPNSAVIANNLAIANAQHGGNLDTAMALAQKARELAPDLVNTADTLGWIQYKKGLYASAVRLLEEAVTKAPGSGTYRYHLGMALVAVGQREKGRGHLEAALHQKLDAEEATEVRDALARLR